MLLKKQERSKSFGLPVGEYCESGILDLLIRLPEPRAYLCKARARASKAYLSMSCDFDSGGVACHYDIVIVILARFDGYVGRVSTRPTTAAHGTGAVGINPDLQQHRSWHPRRRDESRPTTYGYVTRRSGFNPTNHRRSWNRRCRDESRSTKRKKKEPDLPGPFLSCL